MDTVQEFLLRALIVLAVALFVVGLFKPVWVWRWGGEPNRLLITAVALGLFIAGFTGLGELTESGGNELERQLGAEILSKTAYQIGPQTKRCEPGSRPGGAGATDDESGPEGIEYNVRTPVNYDPTIAHPLLMVYAPYGKSRNRTEQFTYLTREATEAGFIISYADHKRLAPETIIELSAIPRHIQEKWCVDKDRVFLTGHSDGGTIAMGIAFINGTKDIPSAIAPSAAGIRKDDLADRSCPRPLSVMVMHSARDTLFPGYGKGSVEWWAACNQCNTKTTQKLENGCTAYLGCIAGVQTWYCENSNAHPVWPGLNSAIIGFLSTAARVQQ